MAKGSDDDMIYSFCGWFLQILIWVMGSILTFTYFSPSENNLSTYFNTYLCTLIIIYVIYFIVEMLSPTSEYLRNKKDDKNFQEMMNQFIGSHPIITYEIKNYHYIANIIKLYTRCTSKEFKYCSSRDVSGPFYINYEKSFRLNKPFIKLKLEEQITFADKTSSSDYNWDVADFIFSNHEDDYYEYVEKRNCPGFKPLHLILLGKENPSSINFLWFVISVLMSLGEIYRLYLNSFCINQEYAIKKIISTNYNLSNPKYDKALKSTIPSINFDDQKYVYDSNIYNYYYPGANEESPTQEALEYVEKYRIIEEENYETKEEYPVNKREENNGEITGGNDIYENDLNQRLLEKNVENEK